MFFISSSDICYLLEVVHWGAVVLCISCDIRSCNPPVGVKDTGYVSEAQGHSLAAERRYVPAQLSLCADCLEHSFFLFMHINRWDVHVCRALLYCYCSFFIYLPTFGV